jgi:hypothetical protein
VHQVWQIARSGRYVLDVHTMFTQRVAYPGLFRAVREFLKTWVDNRVLNLHERLLRDFWKRRRTRQQLHEAARSITSSDCGSISSRIRSLLVQVGGNLLRHDTAPAFGALARYRISCQIKRCCLARFAKKAPGCCHRSRRREWQDGRTERVTGALTASRRSLRAHPRYRTPTPPRGCCGRPCCGCACRDHLRYRRTRC